MILILMLAVVSVLTSVEMTLAAPTVSQWDTSLFVMLSPDPTGVNQPVLVTFQMDKLNPLAAGLSGGEHFKGFTVTIVKPDGKTESKGPYEAWATSGAFFMYTPTMEGKYSFQAFFPGQWANSSTYARWFRPSQSRIVTLTVQHDAVPSMPNDPLPNGYWTRPIYGENKGWSTIADNWLMTSYDRPDSLWRGASAFAPYTSAPDSAHLLWTLPIQLGGIVGGKFGDDVYYTGISYEQNYAPLIISGRIIYTDHEPSTLSPAFGTRCLDLYTGKELWYLNNTSIAFAQTMEFDSGNEHGAIPYLWTTSGSQTNNTWVAYDPFSARQVLTVTNITCGTTSTTMGISSAIRSGPNGELLSYTLDGNANWMCMWNSTKAIWGAAGVSTDYWSPPLGAVIDGSRGIEWNVTVPDVPGSQSIWMIGEGYVLAQYSDANVYPNIYEQMAYNIGSLTKDINGKYPASLSQMWLVNRTDVWHSMPKQSQISNGVYAFFSADKLQFHGYDVRTGSELWVTDPLVSVSNSDWSYFTYNYFMAYGNLYACGYDGHVYCFNGQTGKLIWTYFTGNSGTETVYNAWPLYEGMVIADGKVYAVTTEHSPDAVMWRGGKLHVMDAYTGQPLWNVSGWLKNPTISDGIATSINGLDLQVYTFGKGPSATTVSAPLTAVPLGTGVTITGKVTDQSPGQKETPAISDADMSAWMEYLHMQKQMPVNAKGVPVTISVVDPNGNTVMLGDTTSDIGGSFGFSWTPTMTGKYQIMATFAGTNSYGSSFATTYLTVGPASPSAAPTLSPAVTPTPTTVVTSSPTTPETATPSPAPNTSFSGALGTEYYIAITAAIIIIVVAAIAVVLRRRK
jgi:outer membrane protein assembly factor BamB